MKKQMIKMLTPGAPVKDVFAVTEKAVAQKRNGDNYMTITFSDCSGRIKGVIWDDVDRIAAETQVGDVVSVTGSVGEYNGALQLVVREMHPIPPEDVTPSDFLPKAERDADQMFDRIQKMTASMQGAHWRSLFAAFWQDEALVKGFKSAPAAKKMHHAYIGGLLEHTLSMAVLAEKIAGHYSGVDGELLLAGAVLHDIGKIREFTYDVAIDYGDEGRLLNHIFIGLSILEEKIRHLDDFPKKAALLLKHLIISHHGSREFGSPEPPKTIEAVLLNYIDEIDSKVQGIREFISREPPGDRWTAFHRLLERHFYKGRQA